ncbi:hypothetical protein PPSIR1_19234 [Plesiocystis pacifica SIR-1]|uniref:CHAT domain-containing protein n=1 Tax=Plesiocystis pacifica SIR-1 TaxID=391625 RepID=A6G812_9BACT|nr:SIR2 family protein [Plesiocystis pacifica]EDM77974.1 hypothetical protein PPSIR1_19234 [Plesiocystis pacifica SIR-1]
MTMTIDFDELQATREPLVLYVGAQLAREAGLPSRRELAVALTHALPRQLSTARARELRELAEVGELPDAFTELERELTPARFGREVERSMQAPRSELPPLARAVARLAPRLRGVVTPNLDRVLERAFESRLVPHLRPSTALLSRRNWLLKINGTLPERGSWVLTREQHARVRVRDPSYANVLRALFMAHPVLFVGTTAEDSIFEEVVGYVRDLAEGSPPRHWALLPEAELDRATSIKLDEAGIAAIPCETPADTLAALRALEPGASAQPVAAAVPRRAPPPRGPLRILFVSANPGDQDPLCTEREQAAIQRAIQVSRERDRIELTCRVAASFADLSRALLEGAYEIVHIAGHGEPLGIILDEGGSMRVPMAELGSLFDEYSGPAGALRCVVLNACWSESASEAIGTVPTVITMRGPVDDGAALAYAEGFYEALGAGRDFAAAHREGSRRGRLRAPRGSAPQLVQRG